MNKKFSISATIDLPGDAVEQAHMISKIVDPRKAFEAALSEAFGRPVRMDTKIVNVRPTKEAAGTLAPVPATPTAAAEPEAPTSDQSADPTPEPAAAAHSRKRAA